MVELFHRWQEIPLIVRYWVTVTFLAVALSVHLAWLTIGDVRAEREDRDPIRKWVALEFLAAAGLGFLMRLAMLFVGLIIAAYQLSIVDRQILSYWPPLLAFAATVALAINIWQEVARFRLKKLTDREG